MINRMDERNEYSELLGNGTRSTQAIMFSIAFMVKNLNVFTQEATQIENTLEKEFSSPSIIIRT